jgi:Bacterial archaeo-eukaryotic release factor family 7
VLAISQKDVRLIEATRTTAHEIDLGDLPRNLSDALQYDTPAPGRAPQMRAIYDRKEEIRTSARAAGTSSVHTSTRRWRPRRRASRSW